MPPRKRPSAAQSVSDSGSEEDVKPKVKRQSTSAAKPEPEVEANGSGIEEVMQKNDQGDEFLKLSENRRLTVRSYQKKTLVDLREYYKDKTTGEMKPGSKGISLTKEQWSMLKDNMTAIDAAVAKLEDK